MARWTPRILLPLFLLAGTPGCDLLFGSSDDDGTEEPGPVDEAVPEPPALPDLATEAPAIQAVTTSLQQALAAGDANAAAELFAPDVRDTQRAWLVAHPDLLAPLAAGLTGASVESVSAESGWDDTEHRRSAEIAVPAGSATLRIQLVKVDGAWLFRTF